MGGKMHGHWGGYGPMSEGMPCGGGYGMGYGGWRGMRCPACGGAVYEPSKEEVIEMLEHRKKMLERAIGHINKEIEKLKEEKPSEEHHEEE